MPRWSLVLGQANANAMPSFIEPKTCTLLLTEACNTHSRYLSTPFLFGLHPGNATTGLLPTLKQDLAAFLLMRGPFAWLGWGEWGMTWPPGQPLPAELNAD